MKRRESAIRVKASDANTVGGARYDACRRRVDKMSATPSLPRAVAESRCADLLRQILNLASLDEVRSLYECLTSKRYSKLQAPRIVDETVTAAVHEVVPRRVKSVKLDDELRDNLTTLLRKKKMPVNAIRLTLQAHGRGDQSKAKQPQVAADLASHAVASWAGSDDQSSTSPQRLPLPRRWANSSAA